MTEANFELLEEEKPKKIRFDWILPLYIRPKRTLKTIVEQENAVWLAPLFLLTALALITVLISSPIAQQAASQAVVPPEDFQYYSPQDQESFNQAMSIGASPVMTFVFPAVGKIAGLWIGWLLMGSILHLILTLGGSRSTIRAALNLTAWASLPFALRFIVQSLGMLISHQIISHPGLSGFAAEGAQGFAAFLSSLLPFIDIYFFWQISLLLIGVLPLSNLKRGKAWASVIAAVLIVLILKALPGFIGLQISSLGAL